LIQSTLKFVTFLVYLLLNFIQPPFTSSHLGLNIFLSTLRTSIYIPHTKAGSGGTRVHTPPT